MSSKPHISIVIENCKREDKMWETKNSNIDSSEKTENSKNIREVDG